MNTAAERERAAAALRRSWLATAVAAAVVGVLLLVLARGPAAAWFGAAGALELVAAVIFAVVGVRRAALVRRSMQTPPIGLLVSVAGLAPVVIVGVAFVVGR